MNTIFNKVISYLFGPREDLARIQELESRIECYDKDIKSLKERIDEQQRNNHDSQSEISSLQEKIDRKEEIISRLKDHESQLSIDKKKLDDENVQLKKSCQEVKSSFAELELKVNSVNLLNKEVVEKNVQLQSISDEKQHVVEDLQQKISTLEANLKSQIDMINTYKNKYDAIQIQKTELEKEKLELDQKLVEYRNRFDKSDATLDEFRKNKEEMLDSIKKLQNENGQRLARINELERILSDTNKQITNSVSDPKIEPEPIDNSDENDVTDITGLDTKRTIEDVFDVETGKLFSASDFIKSHSEEDLLRYRRYLEEAVQLHKPRFVCFHCGQMVALRGLLTKRGKVSYFAHLYNSDYCDIKTFSSLTKEEIEARKYGLFAESDRHKQLKNSIAECLKGENSVNIGVQNVEIESSLFSNIPYLKYRRPDVQADYAGKKLIFELQLSTTFVSVVVNRDLFYRVNGYYIIWVFNFDDNKEYVTLENLMCKDIYYSNKRNVFIFDKEAQEQSKVRKQLILKCKWLKPNGYFSDEEFVALDDLKYDALNYKPYYIDADELYFKEHPESRQIQINLEREHKELLNGLKTGIDHDIILPNGYIKRKNGDEKWGLYTPDGEELLPEEYDKIDFISSSRFIVKLEQYWALWGNGRFISSFQYTGIQIYAPNLLLVKQKVGRYRYWGIINFDGVVILPIEYSEIGKLTSGKATIKKENREGYINSEGKIITEEVKELVSGIFLGRQIGLWGIFDSVGVILLPCIYNEIQILTEDRFALCKEGLWALSDGRKALTSFEYIEIHFLNENRFSAVINEEWEKSYSLLDYDGNVITNHSYSELNEFSNGEAWVVLDGEKGKIDLNGNKLAQKELIGDNLFVINLFGKYGLKQNNGTSLLPLEYKLIEKTSDEKIIVTDVNDKTAIYDLNKGFLPVQVKAVDNKFVIGHVFDQWGINSTSNSEELLSYEYEAIDEFAAGRFIVRKNNKWAIWCETGFLTKFEFDEVGVFKDKTATVKKGYELISIDVNGCNINDKFYLPSGFVIFKKDNYYGMEDSNGIVIHNNVYSHYMQLSSDYISLMKNNLWALAKGSDIITDFEFESLKKLSNECIALCKQGVWGVVSICENSLTQLLPYKFNEIELLSDKYFVAKFALGNSQVSQLFDVHGFIEAVPLSNGFRYLNDDRFSIRKENREGVIAVDGTMIYPIELTYVGEYKDGIALVRKNKYEANIDLQGKIKIIQHKKLSDDLYLGEKFGLLGISDATGKECLPYIYKSIEPIGNSRYKVSSDSIHWAISDGYKVLTKEEFTTINESEDELIGVCRNGREGFIDVDGKDSITTSIDIGNDLYKVCIFERYGIQHEDGSIVVPCIYYEIGTNRGKLYGILNGEFEDLHIKCTSMVEVESKVCAIKTTGLILNCQGITGFMKKNFVSIGGKEMESINKGMILPVLISGIDDSNTKCMFELRIDYSKMNLDEIYKYKVEYYSKWGIICLRDNKSTFVHSSALSKPIHEYSIGSELSLKFLGVRQEINRAIWKIENESQSINEKE